MNEFADILKTLRKSNSLSQTDLASMLGISKSAVSMYEQGRREPDFEILGKIADIFQVDTDYLLGRGSTESDDMPMTIAAHLDTSDLTQDELDDVAAYIDFIRSRRKS